MEFNIPKQVLYILDRLNKFDYEAFIVGGCVRDILLKKTPKDFDITTNATPDKVKFIFKEYKQIDIGKKYGTIVVIIDNISYEITTYRTELDYIDNRFPKVDFSKSLYDDVSRRDFTVNSILCDKDFNIVDVYNGVEDLDKKIIRCIRNPDERFNEDALRILRGIRFSAQLNFNIDKETEISMFKNKHLIKNISRERIQQEFNKIVLSDNYFRIIENYAEIIDVFIEGFSKQLFICRDIPCDLELRIAVLFSKYEYECAYNILRDLKYSNKTIKNVLNIIKSRELCFTYNKIYLKKLLSVYDVELLHKMIIYNFYIDRIILPNRYINCLQKIIKNKECYSLKQLDITGYDVKRNIDIDNKKIGNILSNLLKLVIEERVNNTSVELMSILLKYVD